MTSEDLARLEAVKADLERRRAGLPSSIPSPQESPTEAARRLGLVRSPRPRTEPPRSAEGPPLDPDLGSPAPLQRPRPSSAPPPPEPTGLRPATEPPGPSAAEAQASPSERIVIYDGQPPAPPGAPTVEDAVEAFAACHPAHLRRKMAGIASPDRARVEAACEKHGIETVMAAIERASSRKEGGNPPWAWVVDELDGNAPVARASSGGRGGARAPVEDLYAMHGQVRPPIKHKALGEF